VAKLGIQFCSLSRLGAANAKSALHSPKNFPAGAMSLLESTTPHFRKAWFFPDGRIQLAVDMPGEDYSSDARLKALSHQRNFRFPFGSQTFGKCWIWLSDGRRTTPDRFLLTAWTRTIPGSTVFRSEDPPHAKLASVETRLRAGLNLGGLVVGNCLTSGPQKPFLSFLTMIRQSTQSTSTTRIPLGVEPPHRRRSSGGDVPNA